MPDKQIQAEIQAFLKSLNRWCKEGWGRQRQIAKELGVSEPLVSSWVAGRRDPKLDQYLALKKILARQRKAEREDKKAAMAARRAAREEEKKRIKRGYMKRKRGYLPPLP